MPVRHSFESPITDGGDPDLVGPDEWNADHVGDALDISLRAVIRDEMFSATQPYDGGLNQSTSGGSIANTASSVDASHPGVVSVSTGTGTTGRAGIISGSQSSVALAGGEVRSEVIALLPNLSDGTETYTVWTGLADSTTAEPEDGVYFRYTHSVNSGKWQAVCRGADTETATDTGITADTNWHRFSIAVNAAATSVAFSIDGSLVATVTTNIPSALIAPMPVNILKSAGTTARVVRLDAYAYIFEFTTPR